MIRTQIGRWLFALALIDFAAASVEALAAEKAPFYQGKTLNIMITFDAGGPTDIESRILARHLSRHIPGNPPVTIQKMGGGEALKAANMSRVPT
jgi:tripartite-type tricarboxylate transporter receptor subunit TctC